MRWNSKKWALAAACLCLFSMAAGCGSKRYNSITEKTNQAESHDTVQIPAIFLVDAATNKKNNEELVNAFNKEYKGKYEITVQWMSDTEAAYRSQLKLLNVTDELPAIVTDVGFSPSFYQMLIEDKRLVNLAPYLEEDPQWKDTYVPEVLKGCYEDNGTIYLSPASSNTFSYAGMFYNKELFEKAGIQEFPRTWEEFFACCEQLQQTGITPLALHTGGTAWAPMLLATAYLESTQEGKVLMEKRLPSDYSGKPGDDLTTLLKKCFLYTTPDAVNRDFDVAYEHFFKEEAAMIPNGYWMIEQMGEEWRQKIGFAPFPQNVMMASPEMSGWAISSSYSKKVIDGAVEFLKFRTQKTKQQNDLFIYGVEEKSELQKEYIQAVTGAPVVVPNYQLKWNPILQEEVFPQLLPKLIHEAITSEEFVQAMNESVNRYLEEQ